MQVYHKNRCYKCCIPLEDDSIKSYWGAMDSFHKEEKGLEKMGYEEYIWNMGDPYDYRIEPNSLLRKYTVHTYRKMIGILKQNGRGDIIGFEPVFDESYY